MILIDRSVETQRVSNCLGNIKPNCKYRSEGTCLIARIINTWRKLQKAIVNRESIATPNLYEKKNRQQNLRVGR